MRRSELPTCTYFRLIFIILFIYFPLISFFSSFRNSLPSVACNSPTMTRWDFGWSGTNSSSVQWETPRDHEERPKLSHLQSSEIYKYKYENTNKYFRLSKWRACLIQKSNINVIFPTESNRPWTKKNYKFTSRVNNKKKKTFKNVKFLINITTR